MLGQYWPLSLFSQTRMVLKEIVKTSHSNTLQGLHKGHSVVYFLLGGSILDIQNLKCISNLSLTYPAVIQIYTWCKNDTWHFPMEISTEESPHLGLELILVWETSPNSLYTQCSILLTKPCTQALYMLMLRPHYRSDDSKLNHFWNCTFHQLLVLHCI